MEIRSGEPNDLRHLRSIQSQVLGEPWPELLETATEGPPPLFVAVDPKPVGYAIAIADPETVYLPELAVHPERQGEGVGTALIQAVEAHFEECEELRVTVEVDNRDAIRFYETNGFSELERLPDNFESGDGLVFGKDL